MDYSLVIYNVQPLFIYPGFIDLMVASLFILPLF